MMQPLNNKRLTTEEGFSFVEVMVVSMLLGVILSAAYLAMSTVSTASDGIMARNIAQDAGQTAVERMTRELRQAQTVSNVPVDGKVYRFAPPGVTSTKIAFFADVDHNGLLDRVTYELAGGQVTRRFAVATKAYPALNDFGGDSAAVAMAKIDPTQTTMFTCLDKNGSPTTAILDDPTSGITEVEMDLRTIAHSGTQTSTVEFPTAAVTIRSFAAGIIQ